MAKSQKLGCGIAAGALAVALYGANAVAQTALEPPAPRQVSAIDENGVNVATGFVSFSVADVQIGPLQHTLLSVENRATPNVIGEATLATNSGFLRSSLRDNFTGGASYQPPINPGGSGVDPRPSVTVSVGGVSGSFFVNSDGSYTPFNGGSLADNSCVMNQSGTRTFVSADGTEVLINCAIFAPGWGAATKITYPNGLVVDMNYGYVSGGQARLQSVTRSDGFMLKYNYAANGPYTPDKGVSWTQVQSVVALNRAVDYCDPFADTCSYSRTWPTATYQWSGDTSLTVTDQAGLSTRYTMDVHHRVTAVKPPTSNVDKITYEYCARVSPYNCYSSVNTGGGVVTSYPVKDRVAKVIFDGRTWNYTFPTGTYGYYYLPYKATGPTGRQVFALSSIIGAGSLVQVTDSDGGSANFVNDEKNRVQTAIIRGRPRETYTYDLRGNVTSNGFVEASYPTTCTQKPKTCNKPDWVEDARNNRTVFTYDPSHGGALTVTRPAVAGVSPQTRYEYEPRSAWFKATSSGYQQGAAITVLKATSECRTSAATGNPSSPCATPGDEIRVTYQYGPNAAPSNLLLKGATTVASGKTRTVCYGYDVLGRKIFETRPQDGAIDCP